jgi:hypothetical protein
MNSKKTEYIAPEFFRVDENTKLENQKRKKVEEGH